VAQQLLPLLELCQKLSPMSSVPKDASPAGATVSSVPASRQRVRVLKHHRGPHHGSAQRAEVASVCGNGPPTADHLPKLTVVIDFDPAINMHVPFRDFRPCQLDIGL
jgi:hypothetical protein